MRIVTQFHEGVPAFDKDMSLYPDETSVQQPLQDMITTCIDFYISMISLYIDRTYSKLVDTCQRLTTLLIYLEHRYDPTKDENLKRCIAEASESFKETKTRFYSALKKAKQKALERSPNGLATRKKPSSLTNGVHTTGHHVSDVLVRYVLKRNLGTGTQGQVDAMEETSTGKLYARKHIQFRKGPSLRYNEEEKLNEDNVLNEIAIMQKLRHPNIASILSYVKEPTAYSILMQPVADCNLREYLHACTQENYTARKLKPIYSWYGSLVDALSYAHKQLVKHRDIKPANILIKDNEPYLADFGIAIDFEEQDTSSSSEKFTEGAPVYYAPETKINHDPDQRGRSADVFALGCVFSEMHTVNRSRSLEEFRKWRRAPENHCGPYAFRENLPKVREWLKNLSRDELSEVLVEQIKDMLEEDPKRRVRAQKVVDILRRNTAFFV